MLLSFFNLSHTEIGLTVFIPMFLIVFAIYKVLKYEQGLTQIFWLLGIVGAPPFFAIIYLIKIYFFKNSVAESTR